MKNLIFDVKTLIVLVALAVFGLAHADSVTYTYDSLGRITGATYANGAAIQYLYDSNGNRTNLNVTAPTNLPQTISFGVAPAVVVGSTGTVTATGGASGNSVIFNSQTTGVCFISGSTVIGLAAGTCTIAANQAGNANYNAAPQVTQSFNIGLGSQTINFGTAPTLVVGGTGIVWATGGASGNPVTFSSLTTGVCTINGSIVTGVTAGTCTIAANQAGNANYNAAQATLSFNIGMGSQTISFGAAPTVSVVSSGTVSATGGASGNPVTFTSATSGVCSISGSTVTGVTAGACTIAANQAGNANYSAAQQVTQTFTVTAPTNLPQAINFGTAPTVVVGGTGTVSATGGPSGNPVTFSSTTTGVCTISGSTVTGVTVGICTIAANQAGNANYNAAPQVTQSFTISQGSQTLAPTDCLLNWAEQNYPGLFAPAGATTAVSGIYTYRHYSGTNAYVGVSSVDGHVYYLGPDGVMQDEGTLYGWLPKASCPVPTPTDCLFNWAETNYPSLFAPAGAATTVSSGYTSRYYSATKAYLRVSSSDNHVYYMGSDGVMQDEGAISNWLPLAGCQ